MSKKAVCSEREWKDRFEDAWMMTARDECFRRMDRLWRECSHKEPEDVVADRIDD